MTSQIIQDTHDAAREVVQDLYPSQAALFEEMWRDYLEFGGEASVPEAQEHGLGVGADHLSAVYHLVFPALKAFLTAAAAGAATQIGKTSVEAVFAWLKHRSKETGSSLSEAETLRVSRAIAEALNKPRKKK